MSSKKTKRLHHVRLYFLLFLALAIPTLTWILAVWQLPGVRNLELLVYDIHIRSMPHLKPDPRLVLIGMDDASLNRLPGLERNAYPLPRSYHGHLVDELHNAGAKVIGFDVWFTARAPQEEDAVFAAAMRRQGKVVVALDPNLQTQGEEENVTFTEPSEPLRPYTLVSVPLVQRSFGDSARWFLPYPVDSKTTRRYLHLSVALAAAYFGDAAREPLIRDTFHLGRIDAPIGERGEIYIRYIGPPDTYKPVPYYEVYNGTWKRRRGADFFRGKIALIGRISESEDRHQTPQNEMQGVEILANATQTLLQGNYIRHIGEGPTLLAKLGLCVLFALVVWRLSLWWGLAVALLEALLWGVLTNWLFSHGIWIDTVEPVSALALTCVFTSFAETLRIGRIFYRFVPSPVADVMLRAPGNMAAKTAEREVTVVFCDIRQFTDLSETLPSETVEQILHAYFRAGEAEAKRLGAELDKFVGDEIMLYFEPGREPHALRAVQWALAMQGYAQRQDQSGIAGVIGFRIGIGLCTGLVRVGTVGAQERIQGTVIGDAVNVASRLQEATKTVGRPILMSQSTYDQVADRVDAEPMGAISVKGKQEPLTVYCPRAIVAAPKEDRP